jgi:hypothetical protein
MSRLLTAVPGTARPTLVASEIVGAAAFREGTQVRPMAARSVEFIGRDWRQSVAAAQIKRHSRSHPTIRVHFMAPQCDCVSHTG